MHDAAVAAWDAQLAYARPSPAATDDRIATVAGVDPAAPSFPSEHAAIAAAAAAVLAYLLPDAAPGRFEDLAEEAGMSRVWAGAAFRSDIEAGLALGKTVGALAVERGRADGSDAVFDPATMPSGPGFWTPTLPAQANPVEPLGGAWQGWVLERGDQFRPAPPPVYDSPAWRSELLAVQEIVQKRTLAQKTDAAWWQSVYPAIFFDWTNELIVRHGLDTPHAARVLAYQAVIMADALVAVWDAKYTWWTSRPISEDPELVTAFATPPYPAFPSGYSAAIGASAQIVGLFFPDAAEQLDELAWRAARSRAWASIHYPIDNEVGLYMGRQVARLAALRALEEGAVPA
jgi:membrane-associated phospholipid phosphatase